MRPGAVAAPLSRWASRSLRERLGIVAGGLLTVGTLATLITCLVVFKTHWAVVGTSVAAGGVVGAAAGFWASRPQTAQRAGEEWEQARIHLLAKVVELQGDARAEINRADDAAIGAGLGGVMDVAGKLTAARLVEARRDWTVAQLQVPERLAVIVAVETHLAFEKLGQDINGLVRPANIEALYPPPSTRGTFLIVGGGLLLFLASMGVVLRPYLVQVIPGMTWIPDLTKLPPGTVNVATAAVAGVGAAIGTAAVISGIRRVDTRQRWEEKIQAVRKNIGDAVLEKAADAVNAYPHADAAMEANFYPTLRLLTA